MREVLNVIRSLKEVDNIAMIVVTHEIGFGRRRRPAILMDSAIAEAARPTYSAILNRNAPEIPQVYHQRMSMHMPSGRRLL